LAVKRPGNLLPCTRGSFAALLRHREASRYPPARRAWRRDPALRVRAGPRRPHASTRRAAKCGPAGIWRHENALPV